MASVTSLLCFWFDKNLEPYQVHLHVIGAVLATCDLSYLVAYITVLGCRIFQVWTLNAPLVSPQFRISVQNVVLVLINVGIFHPSPYLLNMGNSSRMGSLGLVIIETLDNVYGIT